MLRLSEINAQKKIGKSFGVHLSANYTSEVVFNSFSVCYLINCCVLRHKSVCCTRHFTFLFAVDLPIYVGVSYLNKQACVKKSAYLICFTQVSDIVKADNGTKS